jgi:cell division inhibitor SepF
MAKGWFGKTYDFFFGGDHEEARAVEEPEERRRQPTRRPETSRYDREPVRDLRPDPPVSRLRREGEPVLELHGPPPKPTVEIHYPQSHDDIKKCGELFKEGKLVLVDLENTPKQLRRDVVQFLSGVAFGLGGNPQKVNQTVFLFAPHIFEVGGDDLPSLEDEE